MVLISYRHSYHLYSALLEEMFRQFGYEERCARERKAAKKNGVYIGNWNCHHLVPHRNSPSLGTAGREVSAVRNLSLLVDNTWPQLTPCFISTVLVWVPCGYVWLLLPYFLYDVNNEHSTNNLSPSSFGPNRKMKKKYPHNIANHQTLRGASSKTARKTRRGGEMSVLCVLKIVLTLVLAVLSLVQLLLQVNNSPTSSQVLGFALYMATYLLVAFQLWYERRAGRCPLFVSFYFYTMNMILGIIPLYTWLMTEDYLQHEAQFSILVVSLILNVTCFSLTFLSDDHSRKSRRGYQHLDDDGDTKLCPEVVAPYPSQIFFLWMRKLMLTGLRREITAEDLWDLNPRDQGRQLNPVFDRLWDNELQRVARINDKKMRATGNTKMRDRESRPYGNKLLSESLTDSAYYDSVNERTSLLISDGGRSSKDKSEAKLPNLFWVLARLVFKNAMTAYVQKMLADLSLFSGPMVLGALIKRLQYPEADKVWQAYFLSVCLLVTGMLRSVLFSQSMHRSCVVAIHVKTTLIAAIYKKALTISSSAKKDSTVGEIVNLMSVDCQRLQDILTLFFFLWTTPVQVTIAVIYLYTTIGWPVLTGIALLVLLVPVNTWVGSQQKLIQEAVLEQKDDRIKLVNEILNGMKVLKLYAWEDEFRKKVVDVRGRELHHLRRIALLYVFAGIIWGMAPYLVGFVTFATYVLSDRNNVLDPQKAFVCLALFNLLKVPLFYVSTIITYTVQAYVSVKRVNKFLVTEDLDMSNTTKDPDAENAICIQDGTFTWDRELTPTLRGIKFTIPIGQLTAVVGPVGSGKTSLISAVLGEMEKLEGQVTVNGKVAYVSQQAWIQNATVRDNIIFGKKYNKQRYMQVIRACELERDFEILEAGDQTEIGEKGINLSGGQKQRVNLARAVYSDSDIYLFDDPLSAVDAHVGKAIFKNVMSRTGLLADKTRVLVTHGVHWLPQMDEILVLYNGTISEQGSYEKLVSTNGPFAQFLQMYLNEKSNDVDDEEDRKGDDESDENDKSEAAAAHFKATPKHMTSDASITSADEYSPKVLRKVSTTAKRRSQRVSEGSLNQPLLIHESLDLSTTLTSSVRSVFPVQGKLILEEKLETGKVKRDVFLTYGHAAGMWAMGVAVLSYLLNQGFLVWSSFFLTVWTEDRLLLNASTRTSPEGVSRVDYYLWVYGGFFSVVQVITFLVFNYFFWFRMVRSAKILHHLLLVRLFHAPMSFFDQTPIGRILNRFSKDVDTVDNTLPIILRDWLITISIIAVTLVVIIIKTPIFAAVLVPLCLLFYFIQNYYVRTSRQLKRIESITRSPIYAHFSESITGAAVIRAYGATHRFIQESQKRVDKNQVYYFASQSAIRWLQLNMDLVANLVVLFAAIFQITSGGGGSDAGLSVSYALQISGALTYMVRQVCEFETNIVSVERMREYSQVEQEAPVVVADKRPPLTWPSEGNVQFTDYLTRYREGLDLVLKGVNCHIQGGEKVGIVGRTGAGKSSLTLCLFRIIEAVGGAITIDGINIADIGLHDLRSKLTILPQDPVIFSGSLRMNVDPFEQYTDEQLWTALERSHLKDFAAGQPDRLMYECGEEGANLSIGQRQLVCLARSLLRHTKILILDEATAAIDMETDALIQKTIRDAFQDCTIIAIAHRLNTIMDYDRIIVMDAGVISEFDTPKNLINSRGVFYAMCKDAGLV